MSSKYYNMIGQQYGYLIIKDIVLNHNSTKKHPWRAICECTNCGNKNFETSATSVFNNRTKSCGCMKDQYLKITGKLSTQYRGYEELNGKYWGVIKKRAEKRGYVLNIKIEDAWALYVSQNRKCALSGLPISFAISSKNVSETTASLDRIDSSKGYVMGNIQWVHKDINIMKNVFNQDYFIKLCHLISNNSYNEN